MQITFERASSEDLSIIVKMLSNDPLGSTREGSSENNKTYLSAFNHIEQDPNNEIIVAKVNNNVAGVLQLTYIPSLTYQGSWRAQIEGVRVSNEFRGQGIGGKMISWSIERAKQRGCKIVQLTSDKRRPDAIRFYQQHGFHSTHEGMKLHFD
ncbi:MAG: GNAT family N-acetyltransferase [Kangiellaceae bacterium]|nr:GNAT family N-acetyltransferase [Kangiellaceae bacterium]MCW8998500.1 GNAT family N-acetyltransferase [Kangiellaceae bacterium]